MSRLRSVCALSLSVALFLVVATVAFAQVTPSVTVNDQAIQDSTVTIAQVVSDGPGWIVIHADQDGAPGPVVGHAAVSDGENNNVVVTIDTAQGTSTLYAMLHMDAGTVGTYEFPGADGPVTVEGQVVTPSFTVTGLGGAGELPETGIGFDYSTIALLVAAGGLLLSSALVTIRIRAHD
jgi:hypothetical protein